MRVPKTPLVVGNRNLFRNRLSEVIAIVTRSPRPYVLGMATGGDIAPPQDPPVSQGNWEKNLKAACVPKKFLSPEGCSRSSCVQVVCRKCVRKGLKMGLSNAESTTDF